MNKLLTSLMLACSFSAAAGTPPKNIIMVVGDGMGPAYTTAYRNFKDDPATPGIEQTVFDRLLVGRSSTYPHHHQGFVTDSAASATALATGIKTYNGAIGVDMDKQPQLTVMEQAKQLGKSTGVVVTSQINHATPASYLSHVEQRKMYNQIADSYFDERVNGHFKADVMLGGGWKYFKRSDRDLTQEFIQAGYQYTEDFQQLSQLKSDKVLGLFANVGLPWALDSKQPERLKLMTQVAIDKLDNNPEGFLLLVEGSQIDWAGHANDIGAAMGEMDDLAKALEYLEVYVKHHPDTLVVITADHSTGGLTVGANGKYEWHPKYIQSLKASPDTLAGQLIKQKFDPQWLKEQLGFELNGQEESTLHKAHQQDKKKLYQALKGILDARTNTGWTTGGHTGVDVPVFAIGQSSDKFHGQLDNTDIAKRIFTLLNTGK